MALDPVGLALVQNRLDHIARQMGWVMTRTARSPIFSQSHDFSCFIAGADGVLISQADGIPIHTGGGGFAVRALLKTFGGEMAAEDVYLLNDPYVAGGNHLPDWVIARPVFVSDQLVAFTCNRAHQSDIGGGAAGTYNPAATEIFHEGIRLPPLKLIEGGKTREDLWQLLLLNSRTPDLLDGDLRAMLGSTRIGMERVEALIDDLGLDQAQAYFAGVLDHGDRVFRNCISGLPDGVYIGEDSTDNDCFEPIETIIRTTLTIVGDQVTVDFTGTGPQMKGFKNSSVANTASAVYMALAAFFETDLPRNEGTFRSVEIIAPYGTAVNPRPPAPMTMNTVFIAHNIVHAIWRALALADPAISCAGWGKGIHPNMAGHDSARQRDYIMYHWHSMPGGGAVDGRDGFAQIGHLIALGGLTLPNAEDYEQLYPVLFLKQEMRTDAAGPGIWRGGSGIDYEVDVADASTFYFRNEGIGSVSGWGINGGGDGAAGEIEIFEDGEPTPLIPPAYGVREVKPCHYTAHSPGGGGWGDPKSRPPARVLRDIRDGLVSAEAARDIYGVVLDVGGKVVDETATARLRGA